MPVSPLHQPLAFAGLFGSRPKDKQQQPPQKKKLSFMDGGKFTGKDAIGLALGALGDGLTGQSNTSQRLFGAADHRRKQEAQRDAEMRAMSQAKELATFKNGLPQTAKPDAYERTLAAQGIAPGTPQYVEAMQSRQQAILRDPNNNPVSMNIPGIGQVFGTIEQIQDLVRSRQGGTPTRPVGKLTPIQ